MRRWGDSVEHDSEMSKLVVSVLCAVLKAMVFSIPSFFLCDMYGCLCCVIDVDKFALCFAMLLLLWLGLKVENCYCLLL